MCKYGNLSGVEVGEYVTNSGRRAVITEVTKRQFTEGFRVFGFIEDTRGLWFPKFWHGDGCEYVVYNHGFRTVDGLAELIQPGNIPADLQERHEQYWRDVERRNALALAS